VGNGAVHKHSLTKQEEQRRAHRGQDGRRWWARRWSVQPARLCVV